MNAKLLMFVLQMAMAGLVGVAVGGWSHGGEPLNAADLTEADRVLIKEMADMAKQVADGSLYELKEEKARALLDKARKAGGRPSVEAVADALELVLSIKVEERMGMKVQKTIGAWRARAGDLTAEAADAFGAEPGDFAFATVTVKGGWTIGMKRWRPIGEAEYWNSAYLQGPKPMRPGALVQYSIEQNGVFFPQEVTVNADGTMPIRDIPNAAKIIKLKVPGGQIIQIPVTGRLEVARWMRKPAERKPAEEPVEKPAQSQLPR